MAFTTLNGTPASASNSKTNKNSTHIDASNRELNAALNTVPPNYDDNATDHIPSDHADDWLEIVQRAFGTTVLYDRITAVAGKDPPLCNLFRDMALHVLLERPADVAEQAKSYGSTQAGGSKKRKLDHEGPVVPNESLTTVFTCKDISFQVPLRKKLRLDLCASQSAPRHGELRLQAPTFQTPDHVLRVKDIGHAFCMPQPDVQAPKTNFVVLPRYDAGASVEAMMFTVAESAIPGTAVGEGVIGGQGFVVGEKEKYAGAVEHSLESFLKAAGVNLVRPDEAEFKSAVPQPSRKGERGWHVPAHRGSKEGMSIHSPIPAKHSCTLPH